MDSAVCSQLLDEYHANPNKRIDHAADLSFDGRVVFLHRMTSDVQALAATIALEAAKVLGRHFQCTLYPETVSLVGWPPGTEMAEHRDGHNPHTQHRTHAALIYLNDQTEGGEIYFPALGTVISPRRGLLIAYDKHLSHGVRPVSEFRYTLTLWYTDQAQLSVMK
jgi:hypothetical protein